MEVRLHPHAKSRLQERGATEEEVALTVKSGERFGEKYGRIGFRRNFPFNREWAGKCYATKQVEACGRREWVAGHYRYGQILLNREGV